MEISVVQIISIVLGSSAIGAIVASVGTYFSTSRINRSEREFTFKRDELAKLQEKASLIFGYIYDNKRIIETMKTQLLHGVYSVEMVQLQRNEAELHKIKQELYETMNIYFAELKRDHDDYARPLQGCISVYFDSIQAGQITEELIAKLKKSIKELAEKENDLVNAFIQHLNGKRESIIKKEQKK